ncbi:MAG: hypothetical protein WCT49_02965 [Candidatus Paceibacterota bacterium]|jgi:hypothetical protein|nr:hypothetical protein [Candidatus Paceibacterota bacterium]
MNDPIIQNEVALNYLNTLFGKAIFFKDLEKVHQLNVLRHTVYYEKDFDYEAVLKILGEIEEKLKRYE